jgi:hypothetical protein
VTSHHAPSSATGEERLNLKEHAWPLYVASLGVGLVGLVVSIVLGFIEHDSFRRFSFAYLGAYMFVLAICLGGVFFVMLQHLTRAGWSVGVRRVAEWFASSMPVMAVLSAPIFMSIIFGNGAMYPWAKAGAADDYPPFRQLYLNPTFVIIRLVFYFVSWSWMGYWFWKQSVKQDQSGDYRLTAKMQTISAPAMLLFGLTLTGAAFDLLMSLDPDWASTIFGVYYFAGCFRAILSVMVLSVLFLQSRGFLVESVTEDHFHDLGKLMFAFTFFWGYIAFSQYMLYWYGNMPDETEWFRLRGATTVLADVNGWSVVILLLLFGHFIIPFGGLLSRHVKRNRYSLGFWAVWVLCFCWLDILWLVRPAYSHSFDVGVIDLTALCGVGGVFLAVVLRKAAHDSLRPTRDPRLADSLAFENV